jgi:hypothetical protein
MNIRAMLFHLSNSSINYGRINNAKKDEIQFIHPFSRSDDQHSEY